MRKQRGRRPPAALIVPTVGTPLTFRAEIMPGRDRLERTFQVTHVLNNGRVELAQMAGQHSLQEFERLGSSTEASENSMKQNGNKMTLPIQFRLRNQVGRQGDK